MWGAWRILDQRGRPGLPIGPRIAPRVALGIAAAVTLAAIVTLAAAVPTTISATRSDLDTQPILARASTEMIERLEPHLVEGTTYTVRWNLAYGYSAVATATFTRLARDGWDVRFPPTSATAVGDFRTVDAADAPVLFLVGSTYEFEPPADARVLAEWSPLDPAEEATRDRLGEQLRTELDLDATASLDVIANEAQQHPQHVTDGRTLEALVERGESYTVYLWRPPT